MDEIADGMVRWVLGKADAIEREGRASGLRVLALARRADVASWGHDELQFLTAWAQWMAERRVEREENQR